MVRKSEKRDRDEEGKGSETKGKPEDDVDALFRLPLSEFIAARKTLAAQLKQGGRGNEADRVKTLVKPPISAWAVNQLYWKHRDAFDRLIATGQRFRKAQTSGGGGKVAEMRDALDARREALSELSHLATAVLSEAGHNPSPDTIHRITTTLEGISAYAALPDAASPGRLTQDVDPPGFESFASLIPGAGMVERKAEPARVTHSQKSVSPATKTRKAPSPDNERQLQDTRKARIATAKVSLQDARRVLMSARARAQRTEAAQRKADADAKETEKDRRAAEQRFEKAKAAAEDAARRARAATAEAEEAANAVKDAERTVEEASEELDSLS